MTVGKPREVRIRLNAPHSQVFYSIARFRILVAGRRFGKTYLAVAELLRAAASAPNQKCWYVAPTYRQAKRIAWEILKAHIPEQARVSCNEQELNIILKNGSSITLIGVDQPDSLRGVGLNFVVLDEFQDILPEVWTVIIRPMLATTRGRALFIGTPKGFNHFYDYYSKALTAKNWERWTFKTIDGGYVPPEELEEIRNDPTTTDRWYKQEYEASFESLAGRSYYTFLHEPEPTGNFRLVEDLGGDLYAGLDFNVDPMSCVIGQRKGDQAEILREIAIKNSNTTEMLSVVKNLYPGRRILFYPDPAGNSRSTKSAVGLTDFTLIRSAGFYLYAPKQPYLIIDRVNTVNGMFCNAAGVRRLFVDPRYCPTLIKCLDGLTNVTGTNLPDKSLGIEHIGDALGYWICGMFPMHKRNQVRSKEVRL